MNFIYNTPNKIIYLFLIILGILTILYQINLDDLWLDEMASFWIADPTLSYSEFIERQKLVDWHNPILFNIILKNFLNLVGYNPELSRYLPFVFGALSFFVIGQITYQEKKDNSFILTTFLACSSIYIIKYSQELRPYSLLLLTSLLNILFYIVLLNDTEKKIKNIFYFILFSVLNYSVNPFALIIFFSQIFYSCFRFIFFRNSIKRYFVIYIVISLLYLVFNYNYLLYQITFENYMLSGDIKNVIDGLYFPRFFGSKIMGYFFLILLLSLIFIKRKIFFLNNNNYLFFLIIIIFSYLVPLAYGLVKTPVMHDRYIIFVLIPIFVIIPLLINEIKNIKVKKYLVTFIILITLSNHYIEIFQRLNTKPEFKKTLDHINGMKTENIVLNLQEPSFLVFNYIKNLKISQLNFIYSEYDDPLPQKRKFWLLCYSTDPNFLCEFKNKDNLKIINTKKNLFVETKLYSVN
tara:strand:+ start:14 stop:1405 length:1392 start_codon:yes stop_codon:yes gene_type:complete